jgi:hypothetical protein
LTLALFLSLLSLGLWASPASIEVWMVSNPKPTTVETLLNRPETVFRKPTAALECQEMGDYCFDPQFGLYKKDDLSDVKTEKIETDSPLIPTARSVDRDLITCDKNNYFDIFCGKARADAKEKPAKLDLWIDTSSSMHEFDFPQKDGSCHRKSLVNTLDSACGFNKNVNVMIYDTSIKQAGSIDSVCTNVGLNDSKRLMDWIERSTATKLVIITDIYEFTKEFADFIESKHGTFRGDKDPLPAKDLLNLASDLARSCK